MAWVAEKRRTAATNLALRGIRGISNNVASNVLLYHLQRHSDHHAYPSRRYQALRTPEEAPELPSGYGAMAVVAVIPPLWRRIMDARVTAHYGGDLTLANAHPPKRKRYELV